MDGDNQLTYLGRQGDKDKQLPINTDNNGGNGGTKLGLSWTDMVKLKPDTVSKNQLIFDLDRIITQLQFLQTFRNILLDRALVLNPKHLKRDLTNSRDRMKARSKEKKHFTQWFYDNLASGNIEFKDQILLISKFHTGYRSDLISLEEVESIIKILITSSTNASGYSTPQQSPRSDHSGESIGRQRSSSSGDDPEDTASPPKLTFIKQLSRYDDISNGDIVIKRYNNKIKMVYNNFKIDSNYGMFSICKDKYNGPAHEQMARIFALLGLYSTIEVDNNYLSIPAGVVRLVDFEFFGSPFNTIKPYFSPFPHLEKDFGSYGNFFTLDLQTTLAKINNFNNFSFNPPFTELVIKDGATKLVQLLLARQKMNKPMTVLVSLPVWDSESQRQIGENDLGLELEGWQTLLTCGFIREHTIWKRQVEFYDHIRQEMVPTTNMHIAILSTDIKPILTIKQIEQSWHR